MDRIHYAGDSILTGSVIADALLDYAQVLAQFGSSDTVEIPTVGEDGTPGRSKLLVGPASQVISDAEESEWEDPIDDELAAELRIKAERLRQFGPSTPAVHAEPIDVDDGWSQLDEF